MTSLRFSKVALDCPSPLELAAFYSQLTGLAIKPFDDESPDDVTWIELVDEGRATLAFQAVSSFVAPTWPEGSVPQQLHIDFEVDDLDHSEHVALSLGATKADFQPGESFRIYFDPVGHPFCLVRRGSSSSGDT